MTDIPPKISTLLGFAKKSGKLVSGETAVGSAVKRNAAMLVILAHDLPEKRKMHWENRCRNNKIKYVILGTKEDLGQILGMTERSILAVTDSQMAAGIRKHLSHTF